MVLLLDRVHPPQPLPPHFRRGRPHLAAFRFPSTPETLHKHGKETAGKLASATITLLILVLTAITLIGEAIAIPIALTASISPTNRLTAAMVAIMLPYCVMVCLVAIMGAIAAVHEKFTAQSLSPIILNLFMAAAERLRFASPPSPAAPSPKRVYWVAASVVIAGILPGRA